MTTHDYAIELRWDGDTSAYEAYDRTFRAKAPRKPAIVGSADPAFRGDPTRTNPEDLLVMALASCHMLSYLALCARRGVRVLGYVDDARGRLQTTAAGGRFEEVALRPRVAIAAGGDAELARTLHDRAHDACFIASSCNFPVRVDPTIVSVAAVAPPRPRRDLAVRLASRPGALAELGEILGRAGVSLEGGGGFEVDGRGIVHFLVDDDSAAVTALRGAGLDVLGVRDVVTVRLDQDAPGQLGAFARALADAGVGIHAIYSDHDHQLCVVVDDEPTAWRIAAAWGR